MPLSKIVSCFKKPFHSLSSTDELVDDPLEDSEVDQWEDSEDDPFEDLEDDLLEDPEDHILEDPEDHTLGNLEEYTLGNLKISYEFFALKSQRNIKYVKHYFVDCFDKNIIRLEKWHKLESISLVNGSEPKIIKKWNVSVSVNFISLYNKEIVNEIASNLIKDGDKVQIKIKVNEEVDEFIFGEFIVLEDYITFSNCIFSTQKECYLNNFPNGVQSLIYQLYYQNFWMIMFFVTKKQHKANNITDGNNIKSSTIKISRPSSILYESKDFKKLIGFKFTDFNLSLKQSEEFEQIIKELEEDVSIKPVTLFFEATEEISKINFVVFFSVIDSDGKDTLSEKNSIEITKDGEITRNVEKNLSFRLVEIQEEENALIVILGRPEESIKNSIKTEDSLSIEFFDSTIDTKSTKIVLNAKEKSEGNFIFTTFTVYNDENETTNSKLYNAMIKLGLVSITLNGKNGMIGTYSFSTFLSKAHNCLYCNKLISIPFEKKEDVV